MPGKKSIVKEPPPVTLDASSLVTLYSADDYKFVIDRQCAMQSNLIKAKLEELKDDDEQAVSFPDIQPHILEKAIEYFYYKHRYDNDPEERVEFDVSPTIALDLMVVARQLGC